MDIRIEIAGLKEIGGDLQDSLDTITYRLMRGVTHHSVEAMQEIMATSQPAGKPARGGGKHSAFGQPPAIITRRLFRSLQGKAISPHQAEIEMADYAKHLDPEFDGALNRPFIAEGIERGLARTLADL